MVLKERKAVQNINNDWFFYRRDLGHAEVAKVQGHPITLPHTWNAIDGQDGGNDYYRGLCYYKKILNIPKLDSGSKTFLEFRGVNSSATVYCNNEKVGGHNGGYSTFRVEITDTLTQGDNIIVVAVDNRHNEAVYPQKADFTFYGGIYRDVYLITVPAHHFSLSRHGGPALFATPVLEEEDALVTLEAYVEGVTAGTVRFSIPMVGEITAPIQKGKATGKITIPKARRWNGVHDPYLYSAKAELLVDGILYDKVETSFGCREFKVDKDQGFFLNGKPYPLRGVSKHQDWRGVGNAITPEMMEKDIEIIREMGANTIRLAHYQHDQYVYDLCDSYGIVVWAEIPYISEHVEAGNENTKSQLTELILQNYNHPSIVCWGLSNEITAVGGCNEAIIENHKRLQALSHQLDTTRPTVIANAFMLESTSPLLEIPDLLSYNLYFGWYLGDLEDNDQWFAQFRENNPDKPIGFSEYGADANLRLQTTSPQTGDYTEQYQAVYHEYMLHMFETKTPYLWATHVWNMFDFAADGRDEGGEHGVNQKGLVTFDRKTKKDAFYVYKAYWSKVPFVHLCGRRYRDRTEDTTQVKVYSNLPEVALYCDGKLLEIKKGKHIFIFSVPITGEHTLRAVGGEQADTIQIRKVEKPNSGYSLVNKEVINWFEKEELAFPEGYYSIQDSLHHIKQSPEAAELLEVLMTELTANFGDVAKGVEMPESMREMIDRSTLESMLQRVGEQAFSYEKTIEVNQRLNKIKKPESLN